MGALRKPVFDAVRSQMGSVKPEWVSIIDGTLDQIGFPTDPAIFAAAPATQVTERIQLEILEHEGIACEAYKDSQNIWTWGAGVTDASGHLVARYKDKPSSILRVLEVFEWLLRTAYLPAVLEVFKGFALTEAQLGAALSFHWNTGSIGKSDWVTKFKAGKMDEAKAAFMNWSKPPEIIARRKLERNLFFDGTWTSDGVVTVYREVSKPSYKPKASSARQVDILPMMRDVVARAGA